jgi:2',3'-cyclic-nucleotide 2'-phosphodiesterase (5'-nucleotidase family)
MAFAATASGQTPVPVVERTVTQGDVATRVSLFSNQVVVVTVRRDGEQDFMRSMTLPDDQYMVYLATFQANAEELGDKPTTSRVDTAHAEVVLSLHVGPDAPRKSVDGGDADLGTAEG